MATDNDDILLDDTGDDLVVDGDFAVGDGRLDDCLILFSLNKGEIKDEPFLGPNAVRLMNNHRGGMILRKELSIALRMDSKEYKKLEVVNGNIDFEL